jgi:glycosyltransferase involved in cell wall biosynthesis
MTETGNGMGEADQRLPRVAHVLVGRSEGGAERFFVKLCVALQKRGLPQKVIVSPEPRRVAELRDAGCDVATIPFPRGAFGVLARPLLRRALRNFGAEVALCTLKRAVAIMPVGPWATLARLGGYYDIRKYRRCDGLVALTPDIADWLARQGWPAERIALIPSFAGMPPAEPVDRAQFDTPPGARVILGIGRLHPVKGLDTLLRALPAVPGAWLWLAGDGPMRAELQALATELGVADRTRFLGWRDDQAALYAAADVVAFPSRHEPFGNIVVETWSARRPLVATASEGPGWLIRDGDDGLLCPIDDHAALAERLNQVLGDPVLADRLAAAGWRRHAEDFSEDAVCAQYFDLFRRARDWKRQGSPA